MSPADPRRGSRANLADLVRTAQDAYRERDYEQVIQLLESIPEQKLSEKLLDLLDLCRERVEEVEELKADIEDALGREKFKELREHLERLLEIKPGAKRYRDMLKAMDSVRHGQYRVRLHKDGTRSIDVVGSDFSWGGAVVAVSLLAAVCLGGYFAVRWYMNRPTAQLVVRTDDASLELRVDGERWPWTGTEAARDVQSGPHEVDVLRDGEVVEHRRVKLESTRRLVLTFETAGGTLIVHEAREDLDVAAAEAVPVRIDGPLGEPDESMPETPASSDPATRAPVARTRQPYRSTPSPTIPKVGVAGLEFVQDGPEHSRLPGVSASLSDSPIREGKPDLPLQPRLVLRGPVSSASAMNVARFFLSPDGKRLATAMAGPYSDHLVYIHDCENLEKQKVIDFGSPVNVCAIDWNRNDIVALARKSSENTLQNMVLVSFGDPGGLVRNVGNVARTGASTGQFTLDGRKLLRVWNETPLSNDVLSTYHLDDSRIETTPITTVPSSKLDWHVPRGRDWLVGRSYMHERGTVRLEVEVRLLPQLDTGWKRTVSRRASPAGKLSCSVTVSRDGNEVVAVCKYPETGNHVACLVYWMHRDGRLAEHAVALPDWALESRISDDCRRVLLQKTRSPRFSVIESWSGRTLVEFEMPGYSIPGSIISATPNLDRLLLKVKRQSELVRNGMDHMEIYDLVQEK